MGGWQVCHQVHFAGNSGVITGAVDRGSPTNGWLPTTGGQRCTRSQFSIRKCFLLLQISRTKVFVFFSCFLSLLYYTVDKLEGVAALSSLYDCHTHSNARKHTLTVIWGKTKWGGWTGSWRWDLVSERACRSKARVLIYSHHLSCYISHCYLVCSSSLNLCFHHSLQTWGGTWVPRV